MIWSICPSTIRDKRPDKRPSNRLYHRLDRLVSDHNAVFFSMVKLALMQSRVSMGIHQVVHRLIHRF